jgi:hypothetical protein
MEHFLEMTHLLRICFVTPSGVQEWLHSTVPLLQGRTPTSLIEEGRSDEVIAVLAGLVAGVHV